MTELIRPALYGSYLADITSQDEARDKYTIVGTACESTDVFNENVTLRKTRRGDLLTISRLEYHGIDGFALQPPRPAAPFTAMRFNNRFSRYGTVGTLEGHSRIAV